jgi:hypothetical protein
MFAILNSTGCDEDESVVMFIIRTFLSIIGVIVCVVCIGYMLYKLFMGKNTAVYTRARQHLDSLHLLTNGTLPTHVYIVGILLVCFLTYNEFIDPDSRILDETQVPTVLTNVGNLMSIPTSFDNRLCDYWIASSYNSCSIGQYYDADAYVSLTQLNNVINSGARLLDLPIYKINETLVVSTNSYATNDRIGTLNTLPLTTVLETTLNAFTSAPNNTDPLFILLRINTGHHDIYNILSKRILSTYKQRLLGPEWGFSGHNSTVPLSHEPIQNLKNKVIIIVDYNGNTPPNKDTNPFCELVNISNDTNSFKITRAKNIDRISEYDTIIESKNKINIVLPNWKSNSDNYDGARYHAMGCQFVCMNYSMVGDNLTKYLYKFNNHSFKLKNPRLLGTS